MIFKYLIILLIFSFSLQGLNITNNIEKINKTQSLIKLRKILEKLEEEEKPKKGSIVAFFVRIVNFVYDYLDDNQLRIMNNEAIENCLYQGIIEELDNQKMLSTCIKGSGKALNDFGSEFDCDSNFQSKIEYLTLQFYLTDSTSISSNEHKNILDFLEQKYFYIGLCLPKKCKEAVKFLEHDNNTLAIIHEKGSLSNFKVYYKDDVLKEKVHPIYHYIILFYFFFNLFKIAIGTIRVIYMNKGYRGYYDQLVLKKEKLDEIINDEEDKLTKEDKNKTSLLAMQIDEKDNDVSSFYNQSIAGNYSLSEDINIYNPYIDNEKKYPMYLKIIKALDFYDNVNIISVFSNKYYNSFNIKRLYIVRFTLMIMSIIYQLVYSQMDLPYRYYIKNSFYNSFNFILVKFCINASTFWITLDAVIIGYKIMSFIKKEIILSKYENLQFLSLFKFLLLIIPKFVVFFLALIFLHIFSSNLTFQLCEKNKVYSSFLYYKDTIQYRTYSVRQTENNFWKIYKNFIPFKLNYIDFFKKVEKQTDIILTDEAIKKHNDTNSTMDPDHYTESFLFDASGYELPSPFLTNTDLFVNVYLNEFYLLIILLIITYFSYRLRNKIFDYIILGINIFLFILPAFDLNKHNEKKENLKYTLRYVLGQNYSEKYTHNFINFFYFGFLIGVMKFYHDENMANRKKKKKDNLIQLDLPFEFCKIFITRISKLKFRFKRTILLLSILFMFLISSSFFFMQLSTDEGSNNILKYDMSNSIYFMFLYEKNLSAIFFFIFLTMFIVYPKSTSIIQLAERNGFILIERISFCFYCSFCYLIYAQFCVFIIYFQISFMNLFLNTLGMFLIIFTFSLFNTTLIELPLRQIIKSYMNKDLESKFEEYYHRHKNNAEGSSLNSSMRSI